MPAPDSSGATASFTWPYSARSCSIRACTARLADCRRGRIRAEAKQHSRLADLARTAPHPASPCPCCCQPSTAPCSPAPLAGGRGRSRARCAGPAAPAVPQAQCWRPLRAAAAPPPPAPAGAAAPAAARRAPSPPRLACRGEDHRADAAAADEALGGEEARGSPGGPSVGTPASHPLPGAGGAAAGAALATPT